MIWKHSSYAALDVLGEKKKEEEIRLSRILHVSKIAWPCPFHVIGYPNYVFNSNQPRVLCMVFINIFQYGRQTCNLSRQSTSVLFNKLTKITNCLRGQNEIEVLYQKLYLRKLHCSKAMELWTQTKDNVLEGREKNLWYHQSMIFCWLAVSRETILWYYKKNHTNVFISMINFFTKKYAFSSTPRRDSIR